MDRQIVAIIFNEGGKLISEFLRLRTPRKQVVVQYPIEVAPSAELREILEEPTTGDEKIKQGTACLPCTNSHLHTCVGLLNEAVRMSHDGLTPEGIKRVDSCLGEIAAAERVDLAPENIINLPPGEKVIADYAAKEIREIRHDLEALSSPDQLEKIAAKTAELQHHVGQEWFKERLSKMNPEAKKALQERAELKIKESK